MLEFIAIASGLISSTYGWGESSCGDYGKPRACEQGAVTASGEPFNPHEDATAAIAMPRNRILRASVVVLRVEEGPCVPIRISDKMNERYVGKRGFDLSPAAVRALTGKEPSRHWSGVVHVCDQEASNETRGEDDQR